MASYELETAGQLEPYLDREWLLTNGIGGFASSTVVGCNTRRYHGLLCAALNPPVGRVMGLSRVGEILFLDGNASRLLELSINEFDNHFHPRGDRFLRRFTLDGATATWHFEVEGVKVTKTVAMESLRNAVTIKYVIEPDRPRSVELQLLVFAAMRDFHALRRAGGQHMAFSCDEAMVTVEEGVMRLRVAADGGSGGAGARFVRSPDWWRNHTYRIETERGQDDREDLFTPGHFVLRTTGRAEVTLRAWVEPEPTVAGGPMAEPKVGASSSQAIRRLARASADFVVRRNQPDGSPGTTVIAGYPWFADWGRDTMISLPGLLLCTERFEEARQVLALFASYVSEGMIPNRFDDYTSQPHYNTVDASLWFVHACFEYARASQDRAIFDAILRPACAKIIQGYRDGTRFHIKMDDHDALITQGDANTQLTWMDAKTNGVAFTPRQGKAVEINALWYHALRLMGEDALADRAAESFREQFWISAFRGLCDVVDGERRDTAIRPNQIFAVSLPNSPLTEDQQRGVVEVVRRELLVPVGLRTLSPSDPGYRPRYGGNQYDRDGAYHNGIAWPWPIGAFIEAWLRVNNKSPESIRQGREWLVPLVAQLEEGCVGQIGEIFEAEPPYCGVGAFAQAWSVAEVLRAAILLGM